MKQEFKALSADVLTTEHPEWSMRVHAGKTPYILTCKFVKVSSQFR